MGPSFTSVLFQLAGQAPQIIACLIGVITAAVFWRRCPPAAGLVVLGSVLFVISIVSTNVTFSTVSQVGGNMGWSANVMGISFALTRFIHGTLNAIGIFCLFTAAFLRRPV
ncbi:MAG: hypothetical protein KDA83_20515 [Planctomycetales bacterium]|nr:hypothetical protein [Planctomycetales bacterium]